MKWVPAVVERPFLRMGFNLAARHFMDDGIVSDVREIFEGSPVRLTQIVLEVTERQSLDSLTSARRVIAALQGLGIKVAIDDIGAGHAGLSYMLKLGVDIIKIDKMFIDALGHETSSMTIVETLIDLARNMRMDVIAEGVGDVRAGGRVARARHPRGAGLCVRAAVAGLGLPRIAGGDRSAIRKRRPASTGRAA